MWEDPIVAEVRRAREELSARFNFDVKPIFADMRDRKGALGGRLVSRKIRGQPTGAAEREAKSRPTVPGSLDSAS